MILFELSIVKKKKNYWTEPNRSVSTLRKQVGCHFCNKHAHTKYLVQMFWKDADEGRGRKRGGKNALLRKQTCEWHAPSLHNPQSAFQEKESIIRNYYIFDVDHLLMQRMVSPGRTSRPKSWIFITGSISPIKFVKKISMCPVPVQHSRFLYTTLDRSSSSHQMLLIHRAFTNC